MRQWGVAIDKSSWFFWRRDMDIRCGFSRPEHIRPFRSNSKVRFFQSVPRLCFWSQEKTKNQVNCTKPEPTGHSIFPLASRQFLLQICDSNQNIYLPFSPFEAWSLQSLHQSFSLLFHWLRLQKHRESTLDFGNFPWRMDSEYLSRRVADIPKSSNRPIEGRKLDHIKRRKTDKSRDQREGHVTGLWYCCGYASS